MALCDARDSKHRTSVRHLESLAAHEFAVCDAVLTEACFHLPHRSQRQRLRALLHDLDIQPLPTAHTAEFWLAVLDWLAVLSGRDKDLTVWIYDRKFRTTWRRPDGTAIPLAVKST